MAPAENYYLDMAQSEEWWEPGSSWAGTVTVEKTYRYEPGGDWPEAARKRLLGVQTCLWAENLCDKRLVDVALVPRLMAAFIVFPLVTILADAVGLFGGMLISVFDRSVDAYLYWNTIAYWVVPKDFLSGIGKSVVFGGIVTLIGCYNGLATEGGTEGLGRATTATVVQVAMGVIISDFFLTKLFLFLFW